MMQLNSSGMNRGEGRGREEDAANAEGDVDERAVDEEEGMIWYISHLSFFVFASVDLVEERKNVPFSV